MKIQNKNRIFSKFFKNDIFKNKFQENVQKIFYENPIYFLKFLVILLVVETVKNVEFNDFCGNLYENSNLKKNYKFHKK